MQRADVAAGRDCELVNASHQRRTLQPQRFGEPEDFGEQVAVVEGGQRQVQVAAGEVILERHSAVGDAHLVDFPHGDVLVVDGIASDTPWKDLEIGFSYR